MLFVVLIYLVNISSIQYLNYLDIKEFRMHIELVCIMNLIPYKFQTVIKQFSVGHYNGPMLRVKSQNICNEVVV